MKNECDKCRIILKVTPIVESSAEKVAEHTRSSIEQ